MILLLFIVCKTIYAQYPVTKNDPAKFLDSVNRFIDQSVVSKNEKALDSLFGDDFAFKHGSGNFDTKETWIKSVLRPTKKFLSRVHDSVTVEMHGDIGILFGTLIVKDGTNDKIREYGLNYVRVFRLRNNRWQLISHRTVKEWHYD